MKPAWLSLVASVASGAGLGLAVLVAPADLTDYGGGLANPAVLAALGIAAALFVGAFVAEGGAARASWRAPAGLLTMVFLAACVVYACAVFVVWPFGARVACGSAVAVLALAVLITGAMRPRHADASMRPEGRPAAIATVTLGLYTGALILVAIAAFDGRPVLPFAAVAFLLLTVAAVAKGLDFRRVKAARPVTLRRYGFLALAFVVPMTALGLEVTAPALLAVVAIVALAGVLVERALRIAEPPAA